MLTFSSSTLRPMSIPGSFLIRKSGLLERALKAPPPSSRNLFSFFQQQQPQQPQLGCLPSFALLLLPSSTSKVFKASIEKALPSIDRSSHSCTLLLHLSLPYLTSPHSLSALFVSYHNEASSPFLSPTGLNRRRPFGRRGFCAGQSCH